MYKRKTLAFATPAAILAALAFATPVAAWNITSTCGNGQWIVGIPNEGWATGTTALLDFDQGTDSYVGKGQAVTAPAAATTVVVSFNNSTERLSGSRPQGCVVAVVPTTTLNPTTTTLNPAPSGVVTAWDNELTPVIFPAPVVAVADPPVPAAPVGVLSSGQLPATGWAATSWMLVYAAGLVAAGFAALVITRRGQAT